ncbi:MAG: TIGR01440 family protein [Oscillospiraceae bacterium]|nr:TIGR01440 family protein [Oscillospiraceae bacterium]
MHQEIVKQVRQAAEELLAAASCRERDIFVVGCSSSEILGEKIGTHSSEEAAKAVLEGLYPVLKERGIYLAAQCCEHLNRALILEREAAAYYRLPICNVQPQPKAGGSFATAAYAAFFDPVAVEAVEAAVGMDIGDTLIGMHLRSVAVPVRLSVKKIGEANLVCARTRPKFIGGERAHYRLDLL